MTDASREGQLIMDEQEVSVDVTLYGLPNCVQCRMTERKLTEQRISFEKVNLAEDDGAMRMVKEDLGYQEAPVVIVNADPDRHWSGFQPAEIVELAGEKAQGEFLEPEVELAQTEREVVTVSSTRERTAEVESTASVGDPQHGRLRETGRRMTAAAARLAAVRTATEASEVRTDRTAARDTHIEVVRSNTHEQPHRDLER